MIKKYRNISEILRLENALLAQAAVIVLNARATNDLNRLEVPRDDVEELDKILKDMGVDVSHDEEEKMNERVS